jgi:tetratricopeptide (TPR) repeat protein
MQTADARTRLGLQRRAPRCGLDRIRGVQATLLLIILILQATSSTNTEQDLLREARRLRDAGQFAQAVNLLDQRLMQNPDDPEAARLRAQTLYWLKEIEMARAGYAAALRRHPADERLRLEYARMLAETNDRRSARAVLEPVRAGGRSSADVDTLAGTIDYWEGDLTGAKRLFLEALRKDPAQREASRQLREIQVSSAPWVRVSPVIWHDDQPVDRVGVAMEAGWFASPLLSVTVRSQPEHFSSGAEPTFWMNEVEVSHFAPSFRLETLAAAGVFHRPVGDGLEWMGRAALGVRAPAGITVRGRYERAPYLYTLASLETPVTTQTTSGMLQWQRGGAWLGEAAVQWQHFPDDNASRSAYAWLLAPLARGASGQFQAGYAAAFSDADEDRFVLAHPRQPFPADDPRFDFAGVYSPYYTPARVRTHSVIAALTVGRGKGPVLRAGGSYGLRASEDATRFQAVGGAVVATVERRSFTPWTIRGSVEMPASASLLLRVGAESGRTAFYRWTTASVQVTYRFIPRLTADRPAR